MHLTKEAIKLLAMFNNSCRVFGEKKIANSRYLVNLAKAGEAIDLDQFQKNLPQESLMYIALGAFAKSMGHEEIGRQAVLDFFSGKGHAEFVLEQAKVLNLEKRPNNFAEKFLIGHMLLPVKLGWVKDEAVAVYKNGREVLIQNLITHPFLTDIKKASGQRGFIHFATVIELNPKENEWERILKEQEKMKILSQAAGKVREIDYSKFWDLHNWTEENLKASGF